MAEIRDINLIAAKWVRNSSAAAPAYQEGVQNPRRSWQTAAAAAAPAWQQGVTQAAAAGRFAAGIRTSSDDIQRSMSAGKGANRYPEGVAAAEAKYAARFAPYAAVIRATQLPPRGPRGAAGNLQRVQVIATALNQRRVAGGSNR